MPATRPIGWSPRDRHGHSRTNQQACRPGLQQVALVVETSLISLIRKQSAEGYSSRVQQPWYIQGDADGHIGTSDLLKQLVRRRLPVATDQMVPAASAFVAELSLIRQAHARAPASRTMACTSTHAGAPWDHGHIDWPDFGVPADGWMLVAGVSGDRRVYFRRCSGLLRVGGVRYGGMVWLSTLCWPRDVWISDALAGRSLCVAVGADAGPAVCSVHGCTVLLTYGSCTRGAFSTAGHKLHWAQVLAWGWAVDAVSS